MDEIILRSTPTAPDNEHIVFETDKSNGCRTSNQDSVRISSTSEMDNSFTDAIECSCLNDKSSTISDDRYSPNQKEADAKHPFRSTTGISKSRYSPVQKGVGKSLCRVARTTNLEVAIDMVTLSQAKVSPRILRSPVRKKSPIRWFPRKKTESFLDRKIRMLQEKEVGKIASLDETLGAANLHLCRIEREKLAAQAAAEEAMDARKNALIEASWCRILKLAGVPCNSAILDLQKAEVKASAAMSDAERLGVILQNGPSDRETTSGAVTACFDTAFEVDKEVAAVIKAVLQHLCQVCDAGSQDNPSDLNVMDISGIHEKCSFDFETSSSEAESQSDLEFERGSCSESKLRNNLRPKRRKPRSPFHKSLINLMLKRIVDLSPDHRASLASIVATRGLSALLKAQNIEQELNQDTVSLVDNTQTEPVNGVSGGLGSIMIKHVSQLQRDIDTFKSTIQTFPTSDTSKRSGSQPTQVQSLDQILIKHVSRLEKEKLAAQASQKTNFPPDNGSSESENKTFQNERRTLDEITNSQNGQESVEKNRGSGNRKADHKVAAEYVSDLGSILVKHVPRLEKEKGAALKCDAPDKIMDDDQLETSANGDFPASRPVGKITSEAIPDLSSILVKHVSRLEKDKLASLKRQDNETVSGSLSTTVAELHIEKDTDPTVARSSEKTSMKQQLSNSKDENTDSQATTKKEAISQGNKVELKMFDNFSRRKLAREKQMEDEWGGLSLGNALKRHVSKLELEQAAWRQAEEEAKRRPNLQ